MKSVKVKVLSGVLAVGLVSSVGVAFASTDAGTNLKSWYDGKFGEAAKSIEKQTVEYALNKAPGLAKEYNGLKTDAKNSINSTRDSETSGTQKEVTTAKADHLNSLATQKAEIEKYLSSQFDGISQEADTAIGLIGEEVLKYAQNDLTKHTGKVGQDALTKLNGDLTKSNADALKELQVAITNAKADLQKQIDDNSASRVERIKGIIDKKIADLRKAITEKKDELVAEQQTLLANKAQELEDAAKADLDAAVAGINK